MAGWRLSVLLPAVLAAAAHGFHVAPTLHGKSLRLRSPVKMAVVDEAFEKADTVILERALRVTNHAAALTSLAYFGLVSSTMQLPNTQMPMATLASVITRNLGPTTNAAFSAQFSTLVTPAAYVFLIWPFIAATQIITLAVSILRPALDTPPGNSLAALNSIGKGEPLSQRELAALTLANAAATAWLFVSSNSLPGALPLASALVLPLVPLFAAYPLRNWPAPPALYRPVFQIFSSFTTIASCLALAVELQHGGRLAFFLGKAELCACVFLALVARLVSLPQRSLARRAVQALALSGVVARRLASGAGVAALLRSPSFVGAVALLGWSVKKLVAPEVSSTD